MRHTGQWRLPVLGLFSLSLAAVPQVASAKTMELVFRLKETVKLEELARRVTEPMSPQFGKFYSPEQIAEVAGPSAADYTLFLQSLKARGFEITRESPTRLIVSARAEASIVERTFKVKVLAAEPRGVRPDSAPLIPKDLGLSVSVSGLDTRRKSLPLFKQGHPRASTRALPFDEYDGIGPDAIKEMYHLAPIYKAGFSGKGQHIAIAGYDDYVLSDIQTYFMHILINPAPKVDGVIFNGAPHYDPESRVENEMDAEFSGMIAPGAQIHLFMSSQNNDPGEVQLFTAILDDNRAKIANYSWGDCETHVSQQHHQDMTKVFARAVAQGVNIVAASGDWGSWGCPDNQKTTADWPAAHPYVVGVGGTSAESYHHGVREEAWEFTGGGFSSIYPTPDWQSHMGITGRGFPDVAFNGAPATGQPAWVHYPSTLQWIIVGGTSIGAPQWSGYLALVNEAKAAHTPGATVGFLPPQLYSMTPAAWAATFNDVVKGKNGAFKAAIGWDPTTGWGSMKGDALLDYLVTH